MGLWLWSGNKRPVVPMEVTWFSMPKGGTAKLQQDQDHVNYVFWLGRVLPIMSTHLQAKQLIRSTTSMFFIGWEMQYSENGHSYGQLLIGSFITTMHLSHVPCSFLVKYQITQVTQPHYSPDLVPCDLWLFQKLKSPFKGKKRFHQQWDSEKYNRTADGDSNKGFCSVLNSGRDTERTVWGPKLPTLKGTEASLFYVQCFLYVLQEMSLFFTVHGWILSGQTSLYVNWGG